MPFNLTTTDSYERVGDLIGTYRKYSKAVGYFNKEVAVQSVRIQQECVLLLSQVSEDGRALHDMFNEPSHILRASLLEDKTLDRKLSQRLNERANDSYRQILATLGLITNSLEQIHQETKIHRDGLGDNISRPDIGSKYFLYIVLFSEDSAAAIMPGILFSCPIPFFCYIFSNPVYAPYPDIVIGTLLFSPYRPIMSDRQRSSL